MRGRAERGALLAALIVVLVAVFLTLTGTTVALIQSHQMVSLRQNDVRVTYLAQAGIMRTLYDLKTGGIGLFGVDQPVSGGSGGADDVFIVDLNGQLANYLLVDMRAARLVSGSEHGGGGGGGQGPPSGGGGQGGSRGKCADPGRGAERGSGKCEEPRGDGGGGTGDTPGAGAGKDELDDWAIHNVLRMDGMTVTHVTVRWPDPQPGEAVMRLELNGRRVWQGSAESGEPIDIPDLTLPPQTSLATGNEVRFWTGTMSAKAFVDLEFRVQSPTNPSVVSTQVGRFTVEPETRSADVTIRVIGEARRAAFPFVTRRTLEAVYRLTGLSVTGPGRILSYRELTGDSS